MQNQVESPIDDDKPVLKNEKRRRRLLSVVGVVAMLSVLLYFNPDLRYLRIHNGMTMQEVEELMGRRHVADAPIWPDPIPDDYRSVTAYFYYYHGICYMVEFDSGGRVCNKTTRNNQAFLGVVETAARFIAPLPLY